jgi:TonB family protein
VKRTILAAVVSALAGCATSFELVAPQPVGLEKDNPCSRVEPVQRAQPEYPSGALRLRQPGWVALQYDVAADGTPTNIATSSSSPSGVFDDAATKALQQWRYRESETSHTGCRILFTFRPPDA